MLLNIHRKVMLLTIKTSTEFRSRHDAAHKAAPYAMHASKTVARANPPTHTNPEFETVISLLDWMVTATVVVIHHHNDPCKNG